MKGLRRLPAEAGFVAAGLLLLPFIRVRGASIGVHAGLLAAAAELLLAGAWIRRFVLRVEEETPAPAHAIALGQAALLLYFYLRSAFSFLPGVCAWELHALAAAAGIHLLVRRRSLTTSGTHLAGYGAVWLAFWISALTYLGYRSGRLDPPSSDPDLHTLWARLTAGQGWIVRDLLPLNSNKVAYPSGFATLNAVWIDLSQVSAVAVVNCQIALQALLAVALVLELVFALRRGPAPGITLFLLGLAHAVFSFPVNALAAHFEGTARLAHTAMALLPLTFAGRIGAGPARQPAAPAIVVAGFCLAFSLAINPSHLLVELPFLLGALLLTLRLDWRPRIAWVLVGAAAMAALLWLSDAWFGPLLRGLFHPAAGATALPALRWREAFAAGFAADSNGLGVVPLACAAGPHCPSLAAGLGRAFALPLLAVAAVALLLRRTKAPSLLVLAGAAGPAAGMALACAVAMSAAAFLGPFFVSLLADAEGRQAVLVQAYAANGLTTASALLFFLLLGTAMALAAALVESAWTARALPAAPLAALVSPALIATACAALIVRQPDLSAKLREAWSHHVRGAPESAMGQLLPEDVRLARAAVQRVRPGESVLLPGLVQQMTPWELWYFTLGGARAVPLYTGIPFAFFHAGSHEGIVPYLYRDHVCKRLDLPWLAERGIVWVYQSAQVASDVCLHNWTSARAKYFKLELRDGQASLWRLRTDLLEQARHDPDL